MTKLLEKAFAAVSRLPDTEQDSLAKRLLDDLDAESKWDATFSDSPDVLKHLAREAIEDFRTK